MMCIMGLLVLIACPTPTPKDDDGDKDDDDTATVTVAMLMASIWEDDSKDDCASDTGNVQKNAFVFELGGVAYLPDFSDIWGAAQAAGKDCDDTGWAYDSYSG